MFELVLGLIWTTLLYFIVTILYGNSSISFAMFGNFMTKEEFRIILWPKILIGILMFAGIVIFFIGLKNVIDNVNTSIKGNVVYGIITDVFVVGAYTEDVEVFKANLIIVEEVGTTWKYTESIGMNCKKYTIGDYIKAKRYKNTVNIVSKVDNNTIPQEIKEKLDFEYDLLNGTHYCKNK